MEGLRNGQHLTQKLGIVETIELTLGHIISVFLAKYSNSSVFCKKIRMNDINAASCMSAEMIVTAVTLLQPGPGQKIGHS